MMNEKELCAFLALVAAFAARTGLSDRQLGRLLGASSESVSRWMRLYRDDKPCTSVYRSTAAQVTARINKLNAMDSETGLYATAGLQKGQARLSVLLTAYYGRVVC